MLPSALNPLQLAIRKLASGESLSGDEARGAFELVMAGEASPVQVSALLVGLRAKGETADEVAGVVQ
ncbi:MAG: anthranilate phosphoribosyltransferase, partial [Gemmatimonadaceae bacterium]